MAGDVSTKLTLPSAYITSPDSPKVDASILSRTSTLDHNQGTVWQDLTRFYLENEETIERSLELDVRSNDKASELDAALDTFLETAKVILQGLVALSGVHPVLGSMFNLLTNFTSHTILKLPSSRFMESLAWIWRDGITTG